MQRAIRTQVDDLFDVYSTSGAVDTTGLEDLARQEQKAETDINVLMARFGVSAFASRPELSTGADVDYELDLQTALGAIAQAKDAWFGMPDEIRKAFPTWQHLLAALESGAIVLKPEEERPVPAPVGASASAPTS